MEAKLERITPARAKKYLEQNIDNNRPVNRRWVETIAQMMKMGDWKENGESIKFMAPDKEGKEILLDGQHRLQAIIKTELTQELLVVRGLDKEAFRTIDAGKKRTAADCLAIAGYQQTTTLAAALRTLWLYRLDYTFQVARKTVPTLEIFRLLEQHPDIEKSVPLAHKGRFIVPGSLLVFIHYLTSRKLPTEADEFVRKLTEGTSMDKGDPILTFRDRLFRYKAANVRVRKDFLIGMLFKTWNYWIAGDKIEKLRYKPGEEFPRLTGVDRVALFGEKYRYLTDEEVELIKEALAEKSNRRPYSRSEHLKRNPKQVSLFTDNPKIPPVGDNPAVIIAARKLLK